MNVSDGMIRLKEKYGNPNAVFARGGYLSVGQEVAVIGPDGYLLGRVTRRNKKKDLVIRYNDGKRVWFLNPRKYDILVRW